MLESLIFIFLIFIGGIFLIISAVSLIIGFYKKSSKLKKASLIIGTIPILCIGIIAYWYLMVIPSYNQSTMQDFAGTYELDNSLQNISVDDSPKLILLQNGNYKYIGEKINGLELDQNGKWETGGIDSQFEFYDHKNRLLDFASPFQSEGMNTVVFNLYESNEVRFRKTKSD